MNRKYQRVTKHQFEEALKKFPRMTERARMVAYEVLVHGRSQQEVREQLDAEGAGCTKQMVSYWVTKVYSEVSPSKGSESEQGNPVGAGA